MTDDLTKALNITPLGSQTRSKGPAAYGIGNVPHTVRCAKGSRIIDHDGKEYIDWVCGLGAISLGYGHPAVNEAIMWQLANGITFSLPTRLEAEVGEKLRAVIPCMKSDGMVRFVKTGSEATEAAIRIARKATGRDVILTVGTGYNGWHSWFQAVKPHHPGVPKEYEHLVGSFAYNDLDSLRDKFNEHAYSEASCQVAAVILEPTLFEHPASGFLEGVRALCDRFRTVLIFDEMVIGFRLARAGGQEKYGVVPDLACFGKGMANGMPLAAVCGKRELMEHADVVSGTFGGETLSLAAASAVLDVYAETDVAAHMRATGLQLLTGIAALSEMRELKQLLPKFRIVGHEQVWKFDGLDSRTLGLITQTMAEHSVLWHPRITYCSLAHTMEDVRLTVDAMQDALQAVDAARQSGDWSALRGVPDEPFARKG